MIYWVHIGFITCCDIPSRYYISYFFGHMVIFGPSVFYLFRPLVIFSAIRFSIFSALRIRPYSPVQKNYMRAKALKRWQPCLNGPAGKSSAGSLQQQQTTAKTAASSLSGVGWVARQVCWPLFGPPLSLVMEQIW